MTAFWKDRDPKPETASNEFKDEFDRRVAFADSRFTQAETRGSMTDRGMVFLLLGPPTYVGRKPLTAGDDANDSSALFRVPPADVRIAAQPGGSRKDQVARVDRVTGPGTDDERRRVELARGLALPARAPAQEASRTCRSTSTS